MVVDQTRPNTPHLIRAHRGPNAAAANRNPPLNPASSNRAGHREHKIRKIVPWIQRMRPEVNHLVAVSSQPLEQFLFQPVASVIRSNSKFHNQDD